VLAQKSYPSAYVAACRQTIRDRVADHDTLDAAARDRLDAGHAQLLLLTLDHLFTHRMRGQEGKGALHEVRGLCDQVRDGLVTGATPELTVASVAELAERFLDEIEERFPEAVPV
jgi:hypothetical protein